MKLAILSRDSRLYSTRRLIEAAKERGHEVMVLDVLRCYMNITSMRPEIHYKGERLEGIEGSTGKDIAGMIIGFIERTAVLGKTRTRGRG